MRREPSFPNGLCINQVDSCGGGGLGVSQMTILLDLYVTNDHDHQERDRGPKISKKLTTWFMDDPESIFPH